MLSPAVRLVKAALGFRALECTTFSSSKAPGTLLEVLASLTLSGVKGKAIRVTLSPHKHGGVVMLVTIKGERTGRSEWKYPRKSSFFFYLYKRMVLLLKSQNKF